MANNDLQHSIEIEGYWREMPSGRKVWVKSYSRKGTAAEDDLSAKRKRAYDTYVARNRADTRMEQEYQRNKAVQERQMPGTSSYVERRIKGASLDRFNKVADEYLIADNEYKEAKKDLDTPITTAKRIEFAAIDVKEEVEVFVNNAIEEASFGAQAAADIVVGASKKVVEVVTSGWNAVKSFFGGLFGRR